MRKPQAKTRDGRADCRENPFAIRRKRPPLRKFPVRGKEEFDVTGKRGQSPLAESAGHIRGKECFRQQPAATSTEAVLNRATDTGNNDEPVRTTPDAESDFKKNNLITPTL